MLLERSGFVSDVRKRNVKICWPFSMHNQRMDEHVNVLPPLPVKKFRHWSCQSCLRMSTTFETSTKDGANVITPSDGKTNLLLRASTASSHRETTKSPVRFLQQSEDNNLQQIIVQEADSTRICTDGHSPLLCSNENVASPTSDTIKGS